MNDVLGAILRDVAQARVISDYFSRNVSLEYQRDEVLSGFPVPRAEITQASLELKFAVNEVERREPDREAVIKAHLTPFARQVGRHVYSEFIETDPRGDELEEVIRRKGLTLEEELPGLIERTILDNVPDLAAAMEKRPESLVRKLQGEVSRLVLADPELRDVLTRGTRVRDIRERVSVQAAASVAALARDATPARRPEVEAEAAAAPVSGPVVAQHAARLAERVYSDLVLANPRRDELLKAASERDVRLEDELRQAAERVLAEDPEALRVAIEGEPDALVEQLESTLTSTLLDIDAVKDVFTRRTRVTDIRTRLATLMTSSVASFADDVRAAIDAAKREALSVDVAVTTGDLANIPEANVSRINVVSEIRNYEWVDVGEEGARARRLQPE